MAMRDLDVRGVSVQLTEVGSGPPLLFLHGMRGVDPTAACFARLGEQFRVLLPVHPGFGLSEREPWCNTVHDLAYLYLDLLEELELENVHLMGSSFGGWVAGELAVRSQARLADLVLIDPVGIKVSDRWTRDISDIFALHPDEVARREFTVPPAPAGQRYAAMSDDELRAELRNAEATALYGWEPYMHDTKLHRLLRRIKVPTLLVWGADDGIVTVDYGKAYQAALPNAELVVIDGAAHHPHLEQPDDFVDQVSDFLVAASARNIG